MSEEKQALLGKKPITPLWIVALFVSLTETVLGVAVTQTSGGIQIALTAFVIIFPLLIAGFFFAILWQKPYVFYPPTEFGSQVNVAEYVEAMQRKPGLLKQHAEAHNLTPLTEKEVWAVDEIVDTFSKRLAPDGLLFLYAFSLAHSKNKLVDFGEINSLLDYPVDDDYGIGILSATQAVGLLAYDWIEPRHAYSVFLAKIISMNTKLGNELRSALDRRLNTLNERYFNPPNTKELVQKQYQVRIARLEEYFQ